MICSSEFDLLINEWITAFIGILVGLLFSVLIRQIKEPK